MEKVRLTREAAPAAIRSGLRKASTEMIADTENPEPTPPGGATLPQPKRTRILDYSDPLSLTGRSYYVLWAGVQHGGRHEHLEDAEQHAAKIEEAPSWDHANWLMLHGLREVA